MSKTIFTVQHTQSVHHTNGMIGAWGDWELTDLGRQQAFKTGELLKKETDEGYVIYTSDLKRAFQTAEEINKTLNLEIIKDERIREVNAGMGNGKPSNWYHENKCPRPEEYDPDYKPFPDADSDRTLWERVYGFYSDIMNSDLDKIIIVSHGTTLRFLRSMIIGDSFEYVQQRTFDGPSGGISKFRISDTGRISIDYINKTKE